MSYHILKPQTATFYCGACLRTEPSAGIVIPGNGVTCIDCFLRHTEDEIARIARHHDKTPAEILQMLLQPRKADAPLTGPRTSL
jgi:hypothetical protein